MRKTLTQKERIFLKHVAEGDAITEAAKKGYDVNTNQTAYNIAIKNLKKQKFIELLDKLGITDRLLVEKMKKGLDADKPIVTKDGLIDYPDYQARLGYVKTILRTKGYTNEDTDANEASEPLIIRAVQFAGPTQINITQPSDKD